jgi:hypothetical protein
MGRSVGPSAGAWKGSHAVVRHVAPAPAQEAHLRLGWQAHWDSLGWQLASLPRWGQTLRGFSVPIKHGPLPHTPLKLGGATDAGPVDVRQPLTPACASDSLGVQVSGYGELSREHVAGASGRPTRHAWFRSSEARRCWTRADSEREKRTDQSSGEAMYLLHCVFCQGRSKLTAPLFGPWNPLFQVWYYHLLLIVTDCQQKSCKYEKTELPLFCYCQQESSLFGTAVVIVGESARGNTQLSYHTPTYCILK